MMKRFKLLTMAALVALSVAACDEGETIAPDVTGTIQGRVTVDGGGRAGVTATLTGGRTATTDASGNYSFADVPQGQHEVKISGFPAGTTFQATSQVAVIANAGQVVTVDFSGVTVKNSNIVVTVSGSSGALAGVTVALSGTSTGTQTTSAGGVASFTGLAAGSYTVAISGVPAGQTCPVTSQQTTVGAGETRSLAFTCASSTTASITGRLFLDERDKNDQYDGAALEPNLAAANVLITLEGPTIGVTRTTQTDANGNFSFASLAAGQYNVTIDPADVDLPANVAYGRSSATVGPITLAGGGTATANFPFDIVRQTVTVFAFLGEDEINPGIAPVKGVIIDLYPTIADATNSTNRLGRDTTDASGGTSFNFLRTADTSPQGPADNLVYATVVNPLPTQHVLNGESRIEIAFDSRLQTATATDTFDLRNREVEVALRVLAESDGTALEGWNVRMFADTTAVFIDGKNTQADGTVSFTYNQFIPQLPDTLWFRLRATQPAANGHAFEGMTTAVDGGEIGERWVYFVHNGAVAAGDTVHAGDFHVRYKDVDVVARVFREIDDSLGYSSGDNAGGAGAARVALTWRAPGATTDSVRAEETPDPNVNVGLVRFMNVPVGQGPYWLTARSTSATRDVLEADTVVFGTTGAIATGSDSIARVCPLGANTTAECGTFAIKYNNGTINGDVKSNLGVVINGIKVKITAWQQTVQPRRADTTVTMTGGVFTTLNNVREGVYIVTPLDSVTAAGDTVWKINSPRADTVDLQGNADVQVANFTATRMDTQVRGLVVNDRDGDGNTIDPGEELAGVVLRLYRDGSGAFGRDTLVATDTTDANGGYQFTRLREGKYMVKVATQPTNATVLRGFMGSGGTTAVDSVIVTTTSTANAVTVPPNCDDADLLVVVGRDSPACFGPANPAGPLPGWNYATNVPTAAGLTPTHFTVLHRTGTATGTVTRSANGAPIVGMSVALRRCLTSAAPANPTAGTCTTYVPGFVGLTTVTDSTGRYSFTGLQEGVYDVTPQVGTGSPGSTAIAPAASQVLTINAPGDVETANFTVTP